MTSKANQAAQAAKLIRTDLKNIGIKASVRSSNFAGGNAVDIHVENLSIDKYIELNQKVSKYQYGYFDSMSECYDLSNCKSNLPQAKYVTIHRL